MAKQGESRSMGRRLAWPEGAREGEEGAGPGCQWQYAGLNVCRPPKRLCFAPSDGKLLEGVKSKWVQT